MAEQGVEQDRARRRDGLWCQKVRHRRCTRSRSYAARPNKAQLRYRLIPRSLSTGFVIGRASSAGYMATQRIFDQTMAVHADQPWRTSFVELRQNSVNLNGYAYTSYESLYSCIGSTTLDLVYTLANAASACPARSPVSRES